MRGRKSEAKDMAVGQNRKAKKRTTGGWVCFSFYQKGFWVPFFDSQLFSMVVVFYDCSGLITDVSAYSQQGIGLMVDIKNSVRHVEHFARCLEVETETMPKSFLTCNSSQAKAAEPKDEPDVESLRREAALLCESDPT